ncbi:hypothetical protein AVEN_100080-1 [Araneus ventricosus]|uniref:Uncharacterized protein n=1 Tax=Araneus ventricosus TaxID=182803 RepID=A0A4Y2VKD4_ARAVE|nr:hypothetical protein AVEN_100080-1 [Araneus ventricosus]
MGRGGLVVSEGGDCPPSPLDSPPLVTDYASPVACALSYRTVTRLVKALRSARNETADLHHPPPIPQHQIDILTGLIDRLWTVRELPVEVGLNHQMVWHILKKLQILGRCAALINKQHLFNGILRLSSLIGNLWTVQELPVEVGLSHQMVWHILKKWQMLGRSAAFINKQHLANGILRLSGVIDRLWTVRELPVEVGVSHQMAWHILKKWQMLGRSAAFINKQHLSNGILRLSGVIDRL